MCVCSLQWSEPADAHKPNAGWRLYVFKGGESLRKSAQSPRCGQMTWEGMHVVTQCVPLIMFGVYRGLVTLRHAASVPSECLHGRPARHRRSQGEAPHTISK